LVALAATLFVMDGLAVERQGGQAVQDRVAGLKQAITDSQKQLRQYEWIETTILSVKGEEKSRTQKRCYYGADGAVQKLPIEPGDAKPGGGGRRRGGRVKQAIVENKKEELQDYMERAASLVHHYVPPDPDRIEGSRAAGKVAVRPGPAGQAGLDVSDYLKPGDRLSLEVDATANRLVALTVASYLDTPDDAVTLAVQFGTLPDGTIYNAQSTLDAKAKGVQVVIQNSGYQPIAR
jgi:hypothetical protein